MPTLLTDNGDRDDSPRRRGRRFAAPDSTGAPDGPGATDPSFTLPERTLS